MLKIKRLYLLEGNLLRLAMDHKIPRNEFIKFYVGNEINPNLKKFLDTYILYGNSSLQKIKMNLKISEKG